MIGCEGRSLLLLAIVTAGVVRPGDSHNRACKSELRQLVSKYCDSDVREKRSSGPDPNVREEGHKLEKRQIMSIREIIVASRMPIHEATYQPVPPALWARQRSISEAPALASYEPVSPQRRRLRPLPQESGSSVGFDVSNDELLQLFDEVYGRASRAIQQSFKNDAEKCCRDDKSCEIISKYCNDVSQLRS